MTPDRAKQMVYIYNGENDRPDVDFDEDGDVSIPPDNSIIVRKGRNWKVVRHSVDEMTMDRKMVPIVRVNLTDQL